MDKKFYPGLNRVLIELQDTPASSSALLSTSQSLVKYGEIKAVGAIKDKDAINETMFNVGDHVYILAQSGITMELPEGDYRLINITEILVGVRNDG